jgi:hypothetical protein
VEDRPVDKAITLQASHSLGQNALRYVVYRSSELTEAVRLLGKCQDGEKTPFVTEAVEDIPDGTFLIRLGRTAFHGGGSSFRCLHGTYTRGMKLARAVDLTFGSALPQPNETSNLFFKQARTTDSAGSGLRGGVAIRA